MGWWQTMQRVFGDIKWHAFAFIFYLFFLFCRCLICFYLLLFAVIITTQVRPHYMGNTLDKKLLWQARALASTCCLQNNNCFWHSARAGFMWIINVIINSKPYSKPDALSVLNNLLIYWLTFNINWMKIGSAASLVPYHSQECSSLHWPLRQGVA